MPGKKHLKSINDGQIKRSIYLILYFVVIFFVRIGELTRWLLMLPVKAVELLIVYSLKLVKLGWESIPTIHITIKVPHLSIPKLSFRIPYSFRLPLFFSNQDKPKIRNKKTKLKKVKEQKLSHRRGAFIPFKRLKRSWHKFNLSVLKYRKKLQRFNKRFSLVTKKAITRILFILGRTAKFLALGTIKVVSFISRLIISFILRVWNVFIWILGLPVRLFLSIFSVKFRFFIFGFFMCLLALGAYQSYEFVKHLPSPKDIGKVNYALSTHIMDRNGKLLYEIYHDQNRTPIQINNLPPYIAQATVAIEDKDFYKHNGVSLFSGIIRALKVTILEGNLQGGSTITQQLVKTALLSPERTIERKIKEIILAYQTERLYTKKQILQMYLNQVSYGGPSYGIESAAKTYFNKPAKDLTIAEAALLAGLPQAPSLYSPFTNPSLAVKRRNEVLNKMFEQNYISQKQWKEAKDTPLHVSPPDIAIKAPHFVFDLKSQLEKQYGVQEVEEGGLKVTSTLDLDIQEKAEQILKDELAKVKSLNVTNGAVLITRPSTGEVLAMVGSVDYYATPSGAFNVVTAKRQPGSSVKPIMYSLALERGYTAASIIDDSPTTFGIPGGEPYRPVNYDGKFHGPVPLRYALANSFNIPAVKVLNTLGVQSFIEHAKNMGITTWDDSSQYGLSITLGGAEVKMVDMATAFGVFANQGDRVNLAEVIKINDVYNKTMYELTPSGTHVLDNGIAYIISDILSDNFARQMEFGPHSSLEIPGIRAAVKTGTTDDKKDNWTIGYTPEFLVAVWVGNNDNTPMNPYLTSGITGAAPIWNSVMNYLVKNYGDGTKWFNRPDDVVEKNCYYGKKEYFLRGTESNAQCRDAGSPITPTPVFTTQN